MIFPTTEIKKNYFKTENVIETEIVSKLTKTKIEIVNPN